MAVRLRHRIEYAALRAFAGLFRALPHRAALAAAWPVAALGHWVVGFRRREARRRIRSVLGASVSPRDIRRIAWISWRNLCFNAAELARLPRMDGAWFAARTDYADLGKAREALAPGRGLIFAVAHSGNWDLAGIGAHRAGLPVFFIARPQRNPLTDAYLNRLRTITGADVVANDASVLRNVIRRLRAGGLVAMLPDVRSRTPALALRFLGGTANIAGGIALFARHTDSPILPGFIERVGWTRHRLRLFDPVRPDPSVPKEEDARRMLQAVLDILDREVRAQPEQYFWYNKRWVLDPL
jgi:KDO2-lipid IV(A) lauroyltransferase